MSSPARPWDVILDRRAEERRRFPLRERRAAERRREDRRQAAPIELHLTLNVHVPFWRGSPALIEVAGHVAAPEQRDVALGIVRAEVSRLRPDFVVEDRISITPR